LGAGGGCGLLGGRGRGGRRRGGRGRGREAGSGGEAGVLGWVFRYLAGTRAERRRRRRESEGERQDGTGHLTVYVCAVCLMTRSLRRLFRRSSRPLAWALSFFLYFFLFFFDPTKPCTNKAKVTIGILGPLFCRLVIDVRFILLGLYHSSSKYYSRR
jgi:hypothetical protein